MSDLQHFDHPTRKIIYAIYPYNIHIRTYEFYIYAYMYIPNYFLRISFINFIFFTSIRMFANKYLNILCFSSCNFIILIF